MRSVTDTYLWMAKFWVAVMMGVLLVVSVSKFLNGGWY